MLKHIKYADGASEMEWIKSSCSILPLVAYCGETSEVYIIDEKYLDEPLNNILGDDEEELPETTETDYVKQIDNIIGEQ